MERAVTLGSGDLQLEGILGRPDDATRGLAAVVVCHPHPLHGGNMNNNLVLAVHQELVRNGFVALRFNFRGVGNSQGTHSNGEKEPEDALAALDYLKSLEYVDSRRLGMAGYSFGAGVILGSLAIYGVTKGVVLLGTPIRYLDDPRIQGDSRPKLFVSGDRDHVAPAKELRSKVAALGPLAECRTVPGADHFWAGQETEAARQTVEFFGRTL